MNALREKLSERKPEKTEEEFVQKNYEYFDERVKELEDVIATTVMSFAEGKKALHEVQQLKTNEHVVEDYEAALEEYNAVKQTVGDFQVEEAELKGFSTWMCSKKLQLRTYVCLDQWSLGVMFYDGVLHLFSC